MLPPADPPISVPELPPRDPLLPVPELPPADPPISVPELSPTDPPLSVPELSPTDPPLSNINNQTFLFSSSLRECGEPEQELQESAKGRKKEFSSLQP